MRDITTRMPARRLVVVGLFAAILAVGAPATAKSSPKSDDQAATTQGVATLYSNDQKSARSAINQLLGDL